MAKPEQTSANLARRVSARLRGVRLCPECMADSVTTHGELLCTACWRWYATTGEITATASDFTKREIAAGAHPNWVQHMLGR